MSFPVDSLIPDNFSGIEDSMYCPECKVRTRIEYSYMTNNNDDTYFAISHCIDCERLTFWQYKKTRNNITTTVALVSGGIIDLEPIYTFPYSSEIKIDDVPEPQSKSYLEGVRCLDANAPNGSVAMFRRALQQICTSLGANSSDRLVDQIKILPNDLIPTATEIRQWGNLGSHEDNTGKVLEVNRAQAQSIKNFLERVFLVLYQHPAELKRLQEERS